MKLFEVLPQNIFSVLTSKNKVLYTEALLVLRKAFKQEMTISKLDLISMLIANLDEAILSIDMEAERLEFQDTDDDEKTGRGLSANAHHIMRRLIETGWIEIEYQLDSFDENITLPDYSIKLLNLLHSITDETVREYNSYVYSTYSALRTADSEHDDFMYNAFLTAYENTARLVDELKALHNNIRRYHQVLNQYATANDILKGHFDEYKNLIMDRVYHPLKTLDSVPRFRTPILKILSKWTRNSELIKKISEQGVLRGKYQSLDQAIDDIVLKLGEISDTYEGMDNMLDEIDRKNTAYTRASIEKMHYLLNTDRSIKGKLVDILSSKMLSTDKVIELLSGDINLIRQTFIDDKSLYTRTVRTVRKAESPLTLSHVDENAGEDAIKSFMEKTKKLYSHKKIIAFVNRAMNGRQVVNSREIHISNDEDFVFILLAVLKNSEKGLPYQIEFEDGYVYLGGYRIPNMRFLRKENNSGMV